MRDSSSTVLPLVLPAVSQHSVLPNLSRAPHSMDRTCRCLNLLLELRPPIGFHLVGQCKVEGLQQKASSHAQLQLDDCQAKAEELRVSVCVQGSKAGRAGFEGAGLQRAPRLVFRDGWKCFLVFASFISSLSDSKKQLKSLKTVNL